MNSDVISPLMERTSYNVNANDDQGHFCMHYKNRDIQRREEERKTGDRRLSKIIKQKLTLYLGAGMTPVKSIRER